MINEKTWCLSPETYALLRKKQTAEIDAWLDEHVAQETGYVLDDSLTLANAAAQAKATGDAIAAVDAKIIRGLSVVDGKLCITYKRTIHV